MKWLKKITIDFDIEANMYGSNEMRIKLVGGIPNIKYKVIDNKVYFKIPKKYFVKFWNELVNTLEDENVEKVWMNDKLWYTRIKLDKSFYAPDNYINELEKNNTLVVELESSVLRYFNELTFYKVSPWLHDEYYFNKEYNRKIEIEW